VELNTENPKPVALEVGTYTATVTAFKNTETVGYTAIAEGSKEEVEVVRGRNVTANILLGPKPGVGAGSLSYDITVPENVGNARIIITPTGGEEQYVPLELGEKNEGTVPLSSGIYIVVVSLTKDIEYVGFPEAVYIYDGLSAVLPPASYTESNFPGRAVVDILDLTGILTAPAAGLQPASTITTNQYTGSIAWKTEEEDFSEAEFKVSTTYTAVLTLTPIVGHTFTGVKENAFKYDNATSVTNDAGGNVVTIIFPRTSDQFSGQGRVSLGFLAENIVITSSATKTDSANMTFSVPEEYTNVVWYIDGNAEPATANSIEINPIGYGTSPHTLGVIGTKNGKLYSGRTEFAVWYTGASWELLALISLDDLPEHLASLPYNTADDPHIVSLESFSVSDTGKWETLKATLGTLKNSDVYINLDLRACTADDNTITGGSNSDSVKSSAVFNYMTYTSNTTERLVGLMLPSTLTVISNHALYSSKSLRSIMIPSGVTSIGNSAFSSCTSLTSITIPASVQSIGGSAFTSCNNITLVVLEGVPLLLSGSNPLPHNLNSNNALDGPGTYEYNGEWSKVN
jgi:hypothetical protein